MLASTISTPNCSTITTPIIAWQLSLQDPDINGLGSNYTALLMQHLRGRKVSVCNFSTLSTFLHWLASMKVFTWKKAVAPTLASCLPSTKSLLQVQQLQDKILMILKKRCEFWENFSKIPVQEYLPLHLVTAHEPKLTPPVGHLTLNYLEKLPQCWPIFQK